MVACHHDQWDRVSDSEGTWSIAEMAQFDIERPISFHTVDTQRDIHCDYTRNEHTLETSWQNAHLD